MEISTTKVPTHEQIIALYDSVGWSAYTDQPDVLARAHANSDFLVYAYDDDHQLIGLARAISDDATICYLQDILVHPQAQRTGAGKELFSAVRKRFEHLRQFVLITDDEPGQRAFYESMGLSEGSDFEQGPVRVFAQFN